jgi:hypothetical protein
MGWIPPRLSAEEKKLDAEFRQQREMKEQRDRFAESAMKAAIGADPSFFQSAASIETAGGKFYALADSMMRARSRGSN